LTSCDQYISYIHHKKNSFTHNKINVDRKCDTGMDIWAKK